MNDIIPPKRPLHSLPPTESAPQDEPIANELASNELQNQISPPPKRSWKRITLGLVGALIIVAGLAAAGLWAWYTMQLGAVEPGSDTQVKVSIPSGTDPKGIATILHDKKLIRNTTVFEWYVRLEGVAGSLQSGVYRLSQGADMATIVEHLTSGKTDSFAITFLPGDTLAKHRQALIKAGYSVEVVDTALAKSYDHPLLAGKPASADLEGYIYGETYQFPADATVEQILIRTFDEYYAVIQANDLVARYNAEGLNLYKAITLASIIQREVTTEADQRQVAQVFYLRLKKDMPLGSDVTYQYAADKAGVPRDPALDSPYNTRVVVGLPPGPISSPGKSALIAVGNPAKGDYLYFLSGDDDKTYFARTNDEHETNIRDHCKKKCEIL